jgi:hypothetical protein
VYQVIWQRLPVIFSGADVYSATIVVAAFNDAAHGLKKLDPVSG